MMANRVFYNLKGKGYIEPDEGGGWLWGYYDVPVNRGPQMRGTALLKVTARLHLWWAAHIANKYGFRP